ncbi:MAG: hypothetical protein ACI8ZM_001271 [Crocinitomix sp.]|jgi:hypothetical protein
MRSICIGLFYVCAILLASCTSSTKSDNWGEFKVYYFDFDQVEHYCDTAFVNDHVKGYEANHYDELSREKQLFYATRFDCDHWDYKLSDTAFIEIIEGFNYIKTVLPQEKHSALDDVFREKSYAGVPDMFMCQAVYRDILVFRKKNKITGLVKICFMCSQVCISGTEVDVSNFHTLRAYRKLYDLLQ